MFQNNVVSLRGTITGKITWPEHNIGCSEFALKLIRSLLRKHQQKQQQYTCWGYLGTINNISNISPSNQESP